MNNICIVGAGVTGLSMLLLLQESGTDLSKVVVIDPHFDGGDLARKWGAVQSNTPLLKSVNAIRAVYPALACPEDLNKTSPLIDIIHLLRSSLTSLKKIQMIQGTVTSANYSSDPQRWTIKIGAKEILAKRLILATGSEPKALDLPIPSIPLEIALDASRLKHYIKPDTNALVFGTLHSGTIVIRNLVACGAKVTALYKSPQPFYWDRDGAYDGIKEEAAQIADDIVSGKLPVNLVPILDTSNVIRSSIDADWVVYAIGFEARNTLRLSVDEVNKSVLNYNKHTGALEVPAAWGFGIAYPNSAPDGLHFDVSVAAFLEHMKPQIPAILAGL
jgi:pyruvate/2-oxoglutarate dehydrogenase complex dihydrolipoamide dehydrogenase (E3) component